MAFFFMLAMTVLFLSYANGANDNFKGVATLFGSDTINYKSSIWLATITTFAGSIFSIHLSFSLIEKFSGRGLIPDDIAASPEFLLSVAIGAGLTVMLAALTGFPISTTHSLTGALIGVGINLADTEGSFRILLNSFFLPLLLSPLIAVSLSALLYALFRFIRVKAGICKEFCICVGESRRLIAVPQADSILTLEGIKTIDASIDTVENCREYYKGRFFGIESQRLIDLLHIISAAGVSFSRGLNDTPKIVALIIPVMTFDIRYGFLAIALGMAVGGLLNAHKVARTVSKKITPLNQGQGFAANIATAILVIFASKIGMPVSTTHVSVGSISGVGLINKKASLKMITGILLAWILTLPIAAALGWFFYFMYKNL
jgi:PiT family inorganic phosphate transporter